MIDKFTRYINKEFSFLSKSKVILGVSGGLDSMVLLDIMTSMTPDILVGHVNYKLRGEDSDLDQTLVEAYCAEKGIELEIHSCADGLFSHKGVNLQDKAREIRYEFFNRLLHQSKFDYICTAHHLDDNVETVLLNMFRGTDVKGLAGINPIRGKVVRPLLNFTKAEILRYAEQKGVGYRDDVTNHKSKYSRNFIRNEIIPLIGQRFDNPSSRIAKTIDNISAKNDYIKKLTDQVVSPFLSTDGDVILLDKAIVKQYSNARDILYHWLSNYGFSKSSVADLMKTVTSVGKKILSTDYTLANDRRHLVLYKTSSTLPLQHIEIGEGNIDINLGDGTKLTNKSSIGNKGDNMAIDFSRLVFPLTIRSWEDGDKIAFQSQPELNKKVKKLFVDNKVRMDQKHQIPILVNGNGKLIWVIGLLKSKFFEDNTSDYRLLHIK